MFIQLTLIITFWIKAGIKSFSFTNACFFVNVVIRMSMIRINQCRVKYKIYLEKSHPPYIAQKRYKINNLPQACFALKEFIRHMNFLTS